MENRPRGGILQRDGGHIRDRAENPPPGSSAPRTLRVIIKVVRRYSIPIIKMTSGQRMVLVGIKEEDVEKIWNELGIDRGPGNSPLTFTTSRHAPGPRPAGTANRTRWVSGSRSRRSTRT